MGKDDLNLLGNFTCTVYILSSQDGDEIADLAWPISAAKEPAELSALFCV